MTSTPRTHRGFTLIELLVVVAIIALLIALMLPALGAARDSAITAQCMSNQRQLAAAWTMHADDHDAEPMPHRAPGATDRVYWYGREDPRSGRIDHDAAPIAPYLDAALGPRSVFECPAQPEGTYTPQGQIDAFTTTYGYNAYALAPSSTGYHALANRRPTRIHQIDRPSHQLVFADTLLKLFGDLPMSSALLDPPVLYQGSGRWVENFSPTTAFRHNTDRGRGFGVAVNARADASVHTTGHDPDARMIPEHAIGSISAANDPHYIQRPEQWR